MRMKELVHEDGKKVSPIIRKTMGKRTCDGDRSHGDSNKRGNK